MYTYICIYTYLHIYIYTYMTFTVAASAPGDMAALRTWRPLQKQFIFDRLVKKVHPGTFGKDKSRVMEVPQKSLCQKT